MSGNTICKHFTDGREVCQSFNEKSQELVVLKELDPLGAMKEALQEGASKPDPFLVSLP